MTALARLCVYRFESVAAFDGGLIAAIERMELGDGGELLDALFVARDAASGAVVAIDLAAAGADGTFATLLDFRLDPDRRRAISEMTLEGHRRGVPSPMIGEISGALDGDAAVLVVLHGGEPSAVLRDAAERCGGRAIGDEAVAAPTIGQLGATVSRLLAS